MPVETWAGYLFYLSGIPFWVDAILTTVQHSCGIFPQQELYLSNPRAQEEVKKEAKAYLAGYAAVYIGSLGSPSLARIIKRFWLVPSLLGQASLRFYLLAEHRGMDPDPTDVIKNTRTVSGTNSFYRRLAWNMPYHREHHAWPSVPFHKLPQAHRLLTSAGGVSSVDEPSEGYISFNRRFTSKFKPII
jgi:fatty acid desaturase